MSFRTRSSKMKVAPLFILVYWRSSGYLLFLSFCLFIFLSFILCTITGMGVFVFFESKNLFNMHILKKKICKIIVFRNTDFEVLPVCRLRLNRPSGALSGLLELLQWSQLSFHFKYLSTTTSLVVIFLKRNHKILRRFWPQTMEVSLSGWLSDWSEHNTSSLPTSAHFENTKYSTIRPQHQPTINYQLSCRKKKNISNPLPLTDTFWFWSVVSKTEQNMTPNTSWYLISPTNMDLKHKHLFPRLKCQ